MTTVPRKRESRANQSNNDLTKRSKKETTKPEPMAGRAVEDVYEMEDIIAYRVINGQEYYLVKWMNYPAEEATWEPIDNIIEPGIMLTKKMRYLQQEEARAKLALTEEVSAKIASPTLINNTAVATPAAKQSVGSLGSLVEPEKPVSIAPPNKKVSLTQKQLSKAAPVMEEQSEVVYLKNVQGELHAQIQHKNDRGSEWLPLSAVRESYPQALLDYLLKRVRFRSSENNNGSASAK